MEAEGYSETLVAICQTTRHITQYTAVRNQIRIEFHEFLELLVCNYDHTPSTYRFS